MTDMSNKRRFQISEFMGYAIVGGIATVVDVGSLYVITEFFGIYYLLSNVASFGLGLLTNYGLSIRFVFKHRKMRDARAEFAIFAGVGIAGLVLNTGLLWLFTSLIGIYYLISKGMAVILVFLFNYFVRKYLLF